MWRWSVWLMLIGMALGIAVLLARPAHALSNMDATIHWNITTDSTIRYELRWKHFTDWQWTNVMTDLDSTLGTYHHVFSPLGDSTGDRGACWDMRAVQNGQYSSWDSELGTQVCTQIPLAAVAPTPSPPPPAPTGLTVTSATPDQVVITASTSDCPRVTTSTKGSTSATQKRTVTCVK